MSSWRSKVFGTSSFKRGLFVFFLMASASSAFPCSSLLQNHDLECELQDDYQTIKNSLDKDHGVDAEYTVAYRALRLIDLEEYDRRRRDVNYMPWKIYEPAPITWMLWEHGATMVDKMAGETSFRPLTIEDIERLNEALISKEMMTKLSRLKGNKPGRIRTAANFLPPGAEFKCSENPLSGHAFDLLENYDLKDYEGEPLMRLKFKKKCKEGGHGGQIWYMKSSKVRTELQRWLDHYNSQLQKFLNGDSTGNSPLEFIAEAQRWFIAIHPFGDGNGRTSRFLQDYFLKKLGLPFMPTGSIPMLSTRQEYVSRTKKEIRKSVEYLQGCLAAYEKRKTNSKSPIHGHCLPLYQDLDTGEPQRLKQERLAFAQELKKLMAELESK